MGYFVNGLPMTAGYLSGLRIDESIRNGRILYSGYQFLRKIHGDGRAAFYLTTIMEENGAAKKLFEAKRNGLPRYHDFGGFECRAMSLQRRSVAPSLPAGVQIRRGTEDDGPTVVDYLQRQGKNRQFFPLYQLNDFGHCDGLLKGLLWDDLFLAFKDGELAGTMAAWDQRNFRQCRIAGYGSWMKIMRRPLNWMARFTRMPWWPRPGESLDFFILSLICIRNDDCGLFAALLDEIVRKKKESYSFFLAGLHERDPLLPKPAEPVPRA